MDQAIFQKKYFWNVFCLLCGVLLIGLFLFIGYKDSEATLRDMLSGILFGAIICIFSIISLFFNFKAYFCVEDGHIRGRYHFFGKINCSLSDVAFVMGQNNGLTLLLKNGKTHAIMGVENAWVLATEMRRQLFSLETETPDALQHQLKAAQGAHKKNLYWVLGGIALMFVHIFIAVALTGGKEMYDFSRTDWLLFSIIGVIELVTIMITFRFAQQCGMCLHPIEHLKYRLKSAYIASQPLPTGNVKRVYTDENFSGRVIIYGYPNNESVYYCVQEFVANNVLKTVHTSEIYENEDILTDEADLCILLDITDHF